MLHQQGLLAQMQRLIDPTSMYCICLIIAQCFVVFFICCFFPECLMIMPVYMCSSWLVMCRIINLLVTPQRTRTWLHPSEIPAKHLNIPCKKVCRVKITVILTVQRDTRLPLRFPSFEDLLNLTYVYSRWSDPSFFRVSPTVGADIDRNAVSALLQRVLNVWWNES